MKVGGLCPPVCYDLWVGMDMKDKKGRKDNTDSGMYFQGLTAMVDGLNKCTAPAGSPVIKIKNVTININCYNGRKKR